MSCLLYYLEVTERTLPSYRHSLIPIPGIDWTASRIPLCYLDPAVPNEKLSKIHLDQLFRDNAQFQGDLLTLFLISRNKQRRWFSLDDSSVGCDRRSDEKTPDYLGVDLFLLFVYNMDKSTFHQGESVVRFLNMLTVFGVRDDRNKSKRYKYHQLNEIFDMTYPSVLKCAFEKRSEHLLLVMKLLWDTVCVNDGTRMAMFRKVPDKDHLEFMLQVANTTRFDFWGLRHGETDYIKCIIFCYLWEGRCDWISLLIDYGFKLEKILPREIGRELRQHRFSSSVFYRDPEFRGPLSNIHIMWYLATFCSRSEDATIIRHLDARQDATIIPGFVDMFQKLFRSLLLPTVPHAVVRKCLQPMFPEDIDAKIEHFYECGVIHPIRCEEEVQPKLIHLCRRVVRERLARNFKLPAGIDALNLPTFIKRFLRLEF